MTQDQIRIALLPVGDVQEIIFKAIAAHVQGYMGFAVDILPPVGPPRYALDQRRLQYDAGKIINALEKPEFVKDCDKLIAVLDDDIFVPILTYVFGEARQGGRCALVSAFRLRRNAGGGNVPLSLLMERASKVALHELGHLFNLHHCTERACLMHFSGGIEELDRVPVYLCRYCSLYLRDALHK